MCCHVIHSYDGSRSPLASCQTTLTSTSTSFPGGLSGGCATTYQVHLAAPTGPACWHAPGCGVHCRNWKPFKLRHHVCAVRVPFNTWLCLGRGLVRAPINALLVVALHHAASEPATTAGGQVVLHGLHAAVLITKVSSLSPPKQGSLLV